MARYCIQRAAVQWPDRPALIIIADALSDGPGDVWTFARIERAVLRVAAGLVGAGVQPGERLVVRLGNSASYALTFFGALAAGIVPVATSDLLSGREADFILADSDCAAVALGAGVNCSDSADGKIIIDEDRILAMANGGPQGDYFDSGADDPAYMIYTSGTTADPKGVVHAHRAAWGRRPMYRGWYGMAAGDRVLHSGAFNWTYTLGTGLTDPWANGATAMVYTGTKDPSVWPKLINTHCASMFAAVPGLYRQILKYAPDAARQMPSLRHGLTAGEALPESLWAQWQAGTGTPLYEAFGMSELSTYISSSPTVPRRPGSVGRVQPGRAIAILPLEGAAEPLPLGEVGLLAVHRSDPGLMLGYWRRQQEESQVYRGDWFCGGDLANMDADGYIVHEGRANDLMNAFGYRVSPQEVEQVLAGHPDIAEVAVTEIEVRAGVSIIAAFIVPQPSANPSSNCLGHFAEQHLASYKQPKEFITIDTLPRTANGKIMRRALRERFAKKT